MSRKKPATREFEGELCQECGQGLAEYGDPREPPLDDDVCLCGDCYESAMEERIDELEQEIDTLKTELAEFKESQAG